MQLALSRFVALLNHDFCPDANRFLYWMKKPLAILLLAMFVALACALLLNPQAYAAVGSLTVVIALGLVWPSVALRGLSSSLEWERGRCREGETVRARLVIRNRCPWPVWGITLGEGFRSEAPVVALARVAGFAEAEFEWEFTPPQRGVYPLATPQLSTGFPFGLWQARRACSDVKSLVVWPTTMSLDMLPDLTDSRVSEDRTTDRRAGDCGDLLGTRAFRQGDSLRRIHWAQSARHQRFIVTERQAGVEGSVSVVVDVDAEHHDGSGRESSFEWTLRVAASICECLCEGHLHVECWLGRECFLLHGPQGLRRLLDRMAEMPEGGCVTEGALKENGKSLASAGAVSREVGGGNEGLVRQRPFTERLRSSRSMDFQSVPFSEMHTGWKPMLPKRPFAERKATNGTFEILCTTDVGWRMAAQGARLRRDHRAVVMRTSCAANAVVEDEATTHDGHDCVLSMSRAPVTQRTARPWVSIESEHDVSAEFRQQWRRACRVA